jgi:hypothetical protein
MNINAVGGGGYIRPTWRQAVADYLPESWCGERADRWIGRLPVIVILAIYVVLCLRLNNSVFIDEARNINAGEDYLLHWLNNGRPVDHSAYFSGAPTMYPVIAAILNSAGDLVLVRLFSLACIVVTVVVLQSTVAHVCSSRRAGLLAGCAFAFTAPVVYVGALGTFDAVCLLLLTSSVWAAVTRQSSISAVASGCLLTLGVMANYCAAIFVPFVFLLILVEMGAPEPPSDRAHRTRTGIIVGVTIGALSASYLVAGDNISKGVAFAINSERAPANEQSAATLLGWATLNIGLLTGLAVIGVMTLVLRNRSIRSTIARLCLLTAAALPALTDIWFGDAATFDVHNTYSALLLAPLAGSTLASLSHRLFRLVPVALILLAALAPAVNRSNYLFHTWADVTPVLAAVNKDPQEGLYLSAAADTLDYYTRTSNPQIGWDATSRLYAQGTAAIRTTIEQRKYQMIVVRSVSTASPNQTFLLKTLERSPDYESIEPTRSETAGDQWIIYQLVNHAH